MTSRKQASFDLSISSPALAYEVFKPLRNLEVEELWTLALSPALEIIEVQMIFRGGLSACTIYPREIFRFALLKNASSIIIAHNHPSQQLLPSQDDIDATNRLIKVGTLIEIPLLDHLLITREGFSSFREGAWCDFT